MVITIILQLFTGFSRPILFLKSNLVTQEGSVVVHYLCRYLVDIAVRETHNLVNDCEILGHESYDKLISFGISAYTYFNSIVI